MKAEQSTLDKIRSRPRFKIFSDISPEQYTEQLKTFLAASNGEYEGSINSELSTISVNTPESPFWKPFLTLRAKTEEEQTVIRGVFGPSPSVWTFFMFLYFILPILAMIFVTLWFVGNQIKSEDYTWGLWASIATLGLLLLVYLGSLYGQKKAKAEMKKLRYFAIESSLRFENKKAAP